MMSRATTETAVQHLRLSRDVRKCRRIPGAVLDHRHGCHRSLDLHRRPSRLTITHQDSHNVILLFVLIVAVSMVLMVVLHAVYNVFSAVVSTISELCAAALPPSLFSPTEMCHQIFPEIFLDQISPSADSLTINTRAMRLIRRAASKNFNQWLCHCQTLTMSLFVSTNFLFKL